MDSNALLAEDELLRTMYDAVRKKHWPELGEYLDEGANGVVFVDKNDHSKVVKVSTSCMDSTASTFMSRMRRIKHRASHHIMTLHAFGHDGAPHGTHHNENVMWYHGQRLQPARGFQKGLAFLLSAEAAGVFHEDLALADHGYHHNIMQDSQGNLKFIDLDDIKFRRMRDYVGSDFYMAEEPAYAEAIKNGTRVYG